MKDQPEDVNYEDFRLAITMQDMAYLKNEMGNHSDALLHLREAEEMLRKVKEEGDRLPAELLHAVADRTFNLIKEAQAG